MLRDIGMDVGLSDWLVLLLMLRSRLKAKNLMYINQLLQVLNCFLKVLQGLLHY